MRRLLLSGFLAFAIVAGLAPKKQYDPVKALSTWKTA